MVEGLMRAGPWWSVCKREADFGLLMVPFLIAYLSRVALSRGSLLVLLTQARSIGIDDECGSSSAPYLTKLYRM